MGFPSKLCMVYTILVALSCVQYLLYETEQQGEVVDRMDTKRKSIYASTAQF